MKKRSVAALLGHHKKQNHRSNHRKRSFKRKVKNYLKANCFLYAPLASHSPADLSPPLKTLVHSSAAGLRRNETSRTRNNKKKLLQRIFEFLQSDSHMYAATFIDDPASEPVQCIDKLTIATSRKITTLTHKPITNPTPDHVMEEDTNREGDAKQTRRSKARAMNREIRRLVT